MGDLSRHPGGPVLELDSDIFFSSAVLGYHVSSFVCQCYLTNYYGHRSREECHSPHGPHCDELLSLAFLRQVFK